jgi:Putative peptidoglycan binding domain
MKETEFTKVVKKGPPKSDHAKHVQEWLCLHGLSCKIDRDFGPATEKCVRRYQKKKGFPVTGVVDKRTFMELTAPLRAAQHRVEPNGRSLSQLIVAYGRQNVSQKPREVGGPNRGPWVRLYMDGNDGAEWLWCAGFATFPIKQAAATLGIPMPVLRSFGVANIANHAKETHHFLGQPSVADRRRIKPGSLFLERGGPNGYMHCGIVVSVDGDTMNTLEGNTNDDGSSNGLEAIARTRGFGNMDFALVR